VSKGLPGTHSLLRIEDQHLLQKVDRCHRISTFDGNDA
jgi:hypothetical protein